MFHNFLYNGENIKLHIIEIGNKDLKHVIFFFCLDVEKFFSIINNLSLNGFRVFLVYRCEILTSEFEGEDLVNGFEKFIDSIKVESVHCILESNVEGIYKSALCASEFFDFITVCRDFDELCIDELFALHPYGNKNSKDFIDKVNIEIGNTLPEGEPYLLKVAKKMKLTPRILSKKIKNEGEEFKFLVKKKRHEKALILLENKDINLSDIAYSLGYTEHSAFTRAFKGWAGCSPCQYRKYFK